MERFWSFLTTLDSNTVAQFMKDNLAGTVVVFSLLIWIPASCYVNRIVGGLHICRNIIFVVVPRNYGYTGVPCIRLARGKFESTNQDSAGGKKSSVLTSSKQVGKGFEIRQLFSLEMALNIDEEGFTSS